MERDNTRRKVEGALSPDEIVLYKTASLRGRGSAAVPARRSVPSTGTSFYRAQQDLGELAIAAQSFCRTDVHERGLLRTFEESQGTSCRAICSSLIGNLSCPKPAAV
jgi:hypothetical protein